MDILNAIMAGVAPGLSFEENFAPTSAEIEDGQRVARVYGAAVNQLVERLGLRSGYEINAQPLFGPVLRMMALEGWTLAGSGFFSACFYKGGLTIKFSFRATGDMAIDYAEWVQTQGERPGLPTFYGIQRHSHTATVLMERYEEIYAKLDCKDSAFDEGLHYHFDQVRAAVNAGQDHSHMPTVTTALDIRAAFQGAGHFDLHEANVMMDRDGMLVITDPIGRSKQKKSRYGGYEYVAKAA